MQEEIEEFFRGKARTKRVLRVGYSQAFWSPAPSAARARDIAAVTASTICDDTSQLLRPSSSRGSENTNTGRKLGTLEIENSAV